MAADIYTKAFTDADKWRHAQSLINIMDPKEFLDKVKDGVNTAVNDYAKTPKSHQSKRAQTPKGCTPSAMGAESDTAAPGFTLDRPGPIGLIHEGCPPTCCVRHVHPHTHNALVCFPREDENCHL